MGAAMSSNLLRVDNKASSCLRTAIAAASIATPALAAHKGKLLIKMDMSQEATKEAAFTISSRDRGRFMIQERGRMFMSGHGRGSVKSEDREAAGSFAQAVNV